MNNWNTGEKEFLQSLHKRLGAVNLNWRDDCMIRPVTPELSLVYSMDSFERVYSNNRANDTRSTGRWAASVIANDVIACGVAPRGIALDIGVASFYNEDDVYSFIDGVLEVCACYHMHYEGGNLNRGTFIGGVCWGLSRADEVIRREGAQDNSVLIAPAKIGFGWSIEMLQKCEELDRNILDEGLLGEIAHFKEHPVVNLQAFQEIWNLGVIDCGMDLTDGVVEFGYEIFDRTGLGVVFSPDNPHKLVKYVSSLLRVAPEDMMYEPGYDTPYAHGWCIRKENVDLVYSILKKYKVSYTILGEVTKKVSGVYRKKGKELVPLPRFWDDKLKKESNYELWEQNICGKRLF